MGFWTNKHHWEGPTYCRVAAVCGSAAGLISATSLRLKNWSSLRFLAAGNVYIYIYGDIYEIYIYIYMVSIYIYIYTGWS